MFTFLQRHLSLRYRNIPAVLSLRELFICVNKSEAAAARFCTAGRCRLQGPVACSLPTAFYSYQ